MHALNDFLKESLAPWLLNLHSASAPGNFRDYVEKNGIGCSPLRVSDMLDLHIVCGMRESASKFGCRYELPGIRLVVDQESSTK